MKEYIGTLIWTMLFIVVIEMIFPESQLRKYLKLVLGFMVVYSILLPVLQNRWISIDSYRTKIQDYKGVLNTSGHYQQQVELQQEGVNKLYKEYIEKGMVESIETEVDVKVHSLFCYVNELEIEAVEMVVEKANTSNKEWGIMPIKIGSKAENNVGEELVLENKIKSCLKNFYNLEDANIYITVQAN